MTDHPRRHCGDLPGDERLCTGPHTGGRTLAIVAATAGWIVSLRAVVDRLAAGHTMTHVVMLVLRVAHLGAHGRRALMVCSVAIPAGRTREKPCEGR